MYLEKFINKLAIFAVGVYRSFGTMFLGGQCRFEPSCSQYAIDALKSLPTHWAISLIIKRIIKCRPGGPFGYDPVPLNCSCTRHQQPLNQQSLGGIHEVKQ
jgi:putative membrane protein insertion efficiency factor